MLEQIVSEINKTLDSNFYLAALSLALTLPDICGKAEYPSESVTKRYIKWYNEHVGVYEQPTSKYDEDMPYLSGEVIYNLRNSFLHQGTPNIAKNEIKDLKCRIDKFELICCDNYMGDTSCVSYSGAISDGNIVNRSYTMNVRLLCTRLCREALLYYNNNREKFDFFDYHLEYEEDV